MSTALHINGVAVTVDSIERNAKEVRFTLNGKRYEFGGAHLGNGTFVLTQNETRIQGAAWVAGKGVVKLQLGNHDVSVSPVLATHAASGDAPLAPTAPMPGVIRQVLVQKGDTVSKDQPLIVMEAMKLQTTLKAGANGTVEALLVKVGDLVADGAELIQLKAAT